MATEKSSFGSFRRRPPNNECRDPAGFSWLPSQIRRQSLRFMVVKSTQQSPARRRTCPTLSLKDAVAMIVGIVVGLNISYAFALPPTSVAKCALLRLRAASPLIGAFVMPNLPPLSAYRRRLSLPQQGIWQTAVFLFVWSRVTVIQTGSVALLARVWRLCLQLLGLGEYSPSIYADC